MTEPTPGPEPVAASEPVPDADSVADAGTDTDAGTGTPADTEAHPDWPGFPLEAAAGDADVAALLGRLGALPGLPVSAHGDVYAGLHDDLMEALNEDVTGHEATAGDTAS
jgi:hypothetical protein